MAENPKKASRNASVAQPSGEFCLAHGVERIPFKSRKPGCKARHDAEGQEDRDRAHVGHDEIQERRPSVLYAFVFEEHQEVRGRRHHLPGDKKEEGVIGQDHQEHPREEERIKNHQARYGPVAQKPFDISDGVDGHKKGKQSDDHQKKTGQEIKPQMKRQVGQAERHDDLVR